MKTILNHPNYAITKSGKVYSKLRRKYLASCPNSGGYVYANLNKKQYRVHRLVLETFVGPCPEGMEGCHLNGKPADNRLCNLKWGTASENHGHRIGHGTININVGFDNPNATISKANIIKIKNMLAANCSGAEVSRKFGVSQASVSRIKLGQRWSDIK